MRIINWNIDKRTEPWRQLVSMAHADVALLQEAGSIPPDVADQVTTGGLEHWDSHVWNSRWYEGRFPKLYDRWPMVVQLSDRVEVEWFKQVSPISEVCSGRDCGQRHRHDRRCSDHPAGIARGTVHCGVHVRALDQTAPLNPQQLASRLSRRVGASHHLRPVGVHR